VIGRHQAQNKEKARPFSDRAECSATLFKVLKGVKTVRAYDVRKPVSRRKVLIFESLIYLM
jgi:hypothetical protein